MKKYTKILSLFLALLFVAMAFSACNKSTEEPNVTTNADATAEDKFFLSASGRACKVYYPESFADTNFYSSAMAIASFMDTKAGIKTELLCYTDFVDDGSPAVLIGDTGNAASTEFMSNVKYSDYGFGIIGNKLCVGAHTPATYSKVSNELIDLLSQSRGADLTLTPENNFMHKDEYISATVNGTSLDGYTLVYANENIKKAVDNAVNDIGKSSGAVIKTKFGADTEVYEYEILVGNVGRDETNAFYAESGTYSDYTVKITDKKIAILARDELTLECGVKALGKLFEDKAKAKEAIELTNTSSFTGSFYENAKLKLEARPEGTDLRIGCNNVYFHQNGEKEKIDYRLPILLDSFKYMDSDILLLQEVNPKWHQVMDGPMQTELGYTVVPTSTEITPVLDGRANYTPIWYRAEKVELIDYGYKQYETVKLEPDSYLSSSKSYTWALFKDKATGKQLITVSTHFTWAPENFNPTPDQCRTMDASEVVELAKQLEVEYAGIPIILMGDLNCQAGSNPYSKLMEEFSDVSKVVEANNKMNNGTTHSVGSSSVGGAVIDHTLYTENALNFKMYQHVYNEWSFNSTDHIPLLLDVQFK